MLQRHLPLHFGLGVLILILGLYLMVHPRGASTFVLQSLANSAAPLALAASAQAFPVLTGGLDLSIGGIVAVSNCLASVFVDGSPVAVALGVAAVISTGVVLGGINGVLIVFGRLQPIIATLATGAVYSGLALLILPRPGGSVSEPLSDYLTGLTLNVVPTSILVVLIICAAIWFFVRRTRIGLGILSAGSAPRSASLAGLDTAPSVVLAYALSGMLGSMAGLMLGFQTLSGDPNIGVPYTINSIAAVVIGGLSLRGGVGTIWCGVVGAYTLRCIGLILLFVGAPPLAQPFFEGGVLVIAVAVASYGLVRSPYRMRGMK